MFKHSPDFIQGAVIGAVLTLIFFYLGTGPEALYQAEYNLMILVENLIDKIPNPMLK
jgi:hypothetical protein